MQYQFNRDYSLYIGWKDDGAEAGILVKGLQCEFVIHKVYDTRLKVSTSTIKVYNLSVAQAAMLQERQVTVRLLAGYEGTLKEVCFGNVVEVNTKKDGVDRVTEITVGEAFSILNNTKVVGTIPAGKTIEDVIKEVARQAGLSFGKFSGNNRSSVVLWGYPLTGTTKQQLDEICAAYALSYNIDGLTLSVKDAYQPDTDTTTAIVLNQATGLLSIPYVEAWSEGKKKKDKKRVTGVGFTALLNGAVKPGAVVRLDRPAEQVGEVPNGWYWVVEAVYKGDYRGNDWCMDVKCERIDD